MKKTLLTAIVFVLISHVCFSKIFRIGYPGTAVAGVDFAYTNIAGAMTAASSTGGDTLQLYQQYWPAAPAAINVTKPLTFIGFGYLLDKNSGLQYNNSPDGNMLTINFNSGSGGSIIMGAIIKPAINTSNISIVRSKVHDCIINNSSALSNITILQCVMTIASPYACCNEYACIRETGSAAVTNLYIVNNIMIDEIILPSSSGVFFNNVSSTSSNEPPRLYSFAVKNNIFSGSCISKNSNVIYRNLFSCGGSFSPPDTPNTFNVNMNNVFVNWNAGNIQVDTQMVLKAGSPAIGAGIKNNATITDAGIFGGESGEIYRLSGIPPVPSIYKISAPPAATTNPFNIQVSIRGNN